MKTQSLRDAIYDEEILRKMVRNQKKEAWDLEKDISWNQKLDLTKPLVPLDEDAILFPGAGREQRLVISQFMGLIIAVCIFEMEECLLRLRKECWKDIHTQIPVTPEFVELGDLFFEEELKHSTAFRRYVDLFSHQAGIPLDELLSVLPVIKNTKSEAILKYNVKKGGQCFWWIVALVEQEFLLLYHSFKPFKKDLEPLYFDIHEKHFHEEARHASFPYMILDLLCQRSSHPLNFMHVKMDFAVAQVLQSLWTVQSLSKIKNIKKLESVHPFFETLSSVIPLLESKSTLHSLWKLFTSAPYLSSLLNPTAHHKILRFAKDMGTFVLPLPQHENVKLVKY